jgi:type I restriction enzyme R subunit
MDNQKQNKLNKKELGFEDVIINFLTSSADPVYRLRVGSDYDIANCIDVGMLFEFLESTQPDKLNQLKSFHKELLNKNLVYRLVSQIKAKGVIEVLRKGIEDYGVHLDLLYPQPSSTNNPKLQELYEKNLLSVIRQVHFSAESNDSLDIVIFISGIPVITIELKNLLTGQTFNDAVWQYKQDRSPKEELFKFGRCIAHFALDSEQAWMTTKLEGEKTVFLPFNKGVDGKAGNPVNPNGYKTAYLWEEILQRDSLVNIIQRFADRITEKDEFTGEEKVKQIFPRYHQLDLVRKLVVHAKEHGPGQKYLIQHSAGSGKSNSITWLAYQLVDLFPEGEEKNIFDSIIVVTDRKVLDQQIRNNIKQFAQVEGVVEAITEGSQHLKKALEAGKKIIITTVQKFPFIVDEIGDLPSKKFALIIDEAHSSQSGETSRKMNMTVFDRSNTDGVNGDIEEDNNSIEDQLINLVKSQKLLPNVSYFAFTATPKNKTLELFGITTSEGKHVPFHIYSMEQAIQEGFILDVLANYTTYHTFYNLVKRVENDPEYQKKEAKKKIFKYLVSHPDTIEKKMRIILEHFKTNTLFKINGKAKAMIVASSRKNAVEYFHAFNNVCLELNLPFKSMVAFTGDIDGQTEDSLNGFSISLRTVKKKLEEDIYKFLIVAEKFQTGFDEPLLQTMYVDKKLWGVAAVQTLSRINRICPPTKTDTFVLDFVNTAEEIRIAFEPYYKTTVLSESTDPNKLFDLKDAINGYQVFSPEEVTNYVTKCLDKKPITELHPLLDEAVVRFQRLSIEDKYDYKAKVKSYIRLYAYISQITPFESVELEKLHIYLGDLVKKLIIDVEKEPLEGLIQNIDLNSIRIQKEESGKITLKGEIELEPLPTEMRGFVPEEEKERLSQIVKEMNDRFGGVKFEDVDKIKQTLSVLVDEVRKDEEYIRATRNVDRQNSFITFKNVLDKKLQKTINTNFNLYKEYSDNEEFKKYMVDKLFQVVFDEKSPTL